MVVKIGDEMQNANFTMDKVVDLGSKDYAVVVSVNPEPEFPVYALRNKTTFVDEFVTTSLAKAKYWVHELQKDLDEGYDRHVGETSLADMFASKVKPKAPPGGGLNG